MAKRSFPISNRGSWVTHAVILAVLALLVIWALGGALFSRSEVLSERSADLAAQYLFSRDFAFRELAQGNLPFWNPYIYGGVPFLGDFQSALFYPPNWIFLILPLAVAINWSMALHVFLLAAAVYAWGLVRGLRPVAAGLAGVAAMFSGTFFLHLYAGHLSNLCAMPWAPVIFLGIDQWLARRHAGWLLVSAVAVAVQIFAGHPQYVYDTALIAGLYALVFLPGSPRPGQAAAGLLAIYPAGALLAAVQLLPGWAAASESVRSGGVAYDFAAMFSFPPENLLTAIVPWFFGDMKDVPYWGRCYLWEMSVFAGAGMVIFAGQGWLGLKNSSDRVRWTVLLLSAVILALGAHTPLHRLLYHILPGFSGFRGASKFIFFAGLFLAMLAGMGFDRLLRGDRASRFFAGAALTGGAALLAAGWILSGDGGTAAFERMIAAILATKESYLIPSVLEQADFRAALQDGGVRALWGSGGWLAFFGILFLAMRWRPALVWVAAVMAVAEVFSFARGTTPHFSLTEFSYAPLADFFRQNPGDERILNLVNPDSTMVLKKEGVWGYDPSVLKRYAELVFLSQGYDPAAAGQNLAFRQPHPLLSLLRARLAVVPKGSEIEISPLGDAFPRFFLVSEYQVAPAGKGVLDLLAQPGMDLQRKVILEEKPHPEPSPAAPKGSIRIREAGTDHFDVEVVTETPAILVQTDAYSKDWRVVPLPGTVQTNYQLLPANHAVRAIPLAAGRHLLRIEFVPSGFGSGLAVSFASWAAVVALTSVPALRRRLQFAEL